MIASWMLYAALVGGLMTLAAAAIDRAAATRGRPVRFVWLAAMLLSVVWPAANAARRLLPASAAPAVMSPFTIRLQPMVTTGADGPDRAAIIDRVLLGLWMAASVLFAVRLAQAVLSLRRTRRAWHVGEVDGTTVRLSDNVGPAVVGLRSMDVVLPEWIMSLDAPLRAIVLRHEEEHRAARDPYLLFAAGIAVALMPWNLALWLQERRLRLAIEMDCDGRVLRAHPSPERYGMLMLTIAQRRAASPAMFAPMLSEPATQLEQRIIAMQTTKHRLARVTVYGGSAIAAGALLFACALQADGPTGPSTSPTPKRLSANQTYFDFQVEQQVKPLQGNPGPRYPDMLRSANVEGAVLVQFVADTMGRADMGTFKVLKSTHDLFTASVRASLPSMRFSPARVGGRAVKQLVQMPFQFGLTGTTVADMPRRKPEEIVTGQPRARTTHEQVLRLDTVAVNARGVRAAPGVNHEYVETPVTVSGKPTPVNANQTYYEFQIEKAATPKPGNAPARFPDMLRSANVEGEVLAQFVVDEHGAPDMSTFKVLKSTHDLFTNAVKAALPSMEFYPAEVGGRPVKQLLQMPFQFSLTK